MVFGLDAVAKSYYICFLSFDLFTFHWLHRAKGITAVWVSYQGIYEQGVCQIRETHGYGDFSVLNLLYILFLNLYFHDKAMIHLPFLVFYAIRSGYSFPKAQDL